MAGSPVKTATLWFAIIFSSISIFSNVKSFFILSAGTSLKIAKVFLFSSTSFSVDVACKLSDWLLTFSIFCIDISKLSLWSSIKFITAFFIPVFLNVSVAPLTNISVYVSSSFW